MCGITAAFAYREDAPPIDRAEILRMRDRMASRGPDGEGEWFSVDGRVGLGHRRLSIIDLSPAGAQPMFNADRTLAIIYNGEIYNYKELRSRLAANGYRFQSNSDTEVLLALYETRGGDAMLNDVRGMYAFAIWDDKKQTMFVARDPFGIKPLYYSDNGMTFRLASQVKALQAGGAIDLAPDPAGHVGFFLWGHVPDPFTMFRNIRSLPAGHCMRVDRSGAHAPREFCSVSKILADAENAADKRGPLSVNSYQLLGSKSSHPDNREQITDNSQHLRSALAETVRYHLVADVAVGVFLSSGLDSTMIAALAAEQGGDLRTVTLGFEEFKGTPSDEVPLAEEFAKRCGAKHQTIWVSRENFESERDHLFDAMDRPSIDGVNTFFVSLAAKRAGLKVALSGLGGDELFASYPSFHEIPRSVQFLRAFSAWRKLGSGLRVLSAPFLKRMTSPKYAGLFEYGGTYSGAYLLRRGMFMPWELPDLLDPDFVREGWRELQTLVRLDETLDDIRNPRLKISALEMNWYMRNQLLCDSDWAGMSHSVEIRVPFVDVDLLRQVAPLFGREPALTKRDVAQACFATKEARSSASGSLEPPARRELEVRGSREQRAGNAAISELRTPNSELLTSVLARAKTGFQVPIRDWLFADASSSKLGDRRSGNSQLKAGSAGRSLNYQLPSRDRGLRGWAKEVYSQYRTGDESCVLCPPSSVLSKPALGPWPLALGKKRRRHGPSRTGITPTRPHAAAKLRILMLLSDGFGGFGGIAKFNRDFIHALSSSSDVEEVVALPRLMPEEPGTVPPKVEYSTAGLGGKGRYISAVLRAARQMRLAAKRKEQSAKSKASGAGQGSSPLASNFELLTSVKPVIICGHINLLPAAAAARRLTGGELYLIIHGIEAWQPTPDPIANRCVRYIDDFISVSALTRRRFLRWSGLRQDQGIVLPDCVDLSAFKPGPKSDELVRRYKLEEHASSDTSTVQRFNGSTVPIVLTLGRLDSRERYKGIDEVIECLPEIGKTRGHTSESVKIPGVTYLIAGDGDDRPRLVDKARSLGLQVEDYAGSNVDATSGIGFQPMSSAKHWQDANATASARSSASRVIFTGRVGEDVKADYIRLADLFVLVGWGEGFGIVLLEAMACGVPVIGSKLDATREALREGKLGALVDPKNRSELTAAIVRGLNSPADRTKPIPGVEYFSSERFEDRVHALLGRIAGPRDH